MSENGAVVTESAEKPRRSVWGIVMLVGAIAFLGVVILGIFFPTFVHFGATPFARNMARARSVASLCQTHAKEHGGKFPASLAAIDPPIEKTIGGPWQYYDYDSSRPYDWLYFPGATTEDGAKRIILASPTASTREAKDTKERIVFFADGHNETLPESQFQQFLQNPATELKQ